MASGRLFEAVPADSVGQEDDIETAFESWKEGLEDSESPGHIRAFRIPLDDQGRASHNTPGQVRLGSWPIDQYDFDTLCTKLMREYMLPGETTMAVRLIGTLAGKAGVRFNKIVTLQRPNPSTPALPAPAKDGMADVMRAMQESNERMMRIFQEMKGGQDSGGGQSEMMRSIAMMRVLMEPMQSMMAPILAAVAGRPVPAPGPSSSMKETIETFMLMDKFMGRRGGSQGGDHAGGLSDVAQIATAVSGVAKPLLEMAVLSKAGEMRTRKSRQSTEPPSPPPAPMVSPQPATFQPTPAPHVGVDLSQPSPLSRGSLEPGADINAPSHMHVGNESMFAEIKKQVDALAALASSGADPVAVADRFFEDFMLAIEDDEAYGKLCAAIERDNFVSTIAIYNSSVTQRAEWFGQLRDQLLKRIKEEDSAG